VSRVDYHGEFWFPVPPSQLWETIERFEDFESWWAWLADFRADGIGLVSGNVLRGTVIPPVPYRLHLNVRLRRCDRPGLIEAAVGGDLSGRAVLRLEAAGQGTRAAVAWSVEMRSAPLRIAARVAYPLMRWGHDRVVDMAVSGFRRRALAVPAAAELAAREGGDARPEAAPTCGHGAGG
jgi:hypothetical protein